MGSLLEDSHDSKACIGRLGCRDHDLRNANLPGAARQGARVPQVLRKERPAAHQPIRETYRLLDQGVRDAQFRSVPLGLRRLRPPQRAAREARPGQGMAGLRADAPPLARAPGERLPRSRALLAGEVMEEIVFLERDSLEAEVRRPAFAHEWREHTGIPSPEETARLLERATIAIVNKVPLRQDMLAKLPKLRMIAVAATGTDNVDIAACKARGIVVSNVRGYAEHTVPEHAFGLILALRRNLLAWRADVQAGKWQRSERFCLSGHPVQDLHGGTLGIFGEGSIGQGVARLARGFGMHVLFADHAPPKAPDVQFTPPDEVLARSDVVSLHLPLVSTTRNLIGAKELSRMKKNAL